MSWEQAKKKKKEKRRRVGRVWRVEAQIIMEKCRKLQLSFPIETDSLTVVFNEIKRNELERN